MTIITQPAPTPAAEPRLPTGTYRRVRGAVGVVVAVGLALSVGWGAAWWASRVADPGVPTSPAVESTWGIQVTSVTTTADGGLVDLRFVVLDPGKAAAAMDGRNVAPRLLVGDADTVLLPSMTVHRGLTAGHSYFLLYRNTGGLVRPGHEISVLVGKLRIEHVVPG